MRASDLVVTGRGPRFDRLRLFLIPATVVAGMVAVPYALLAGAIWAASGSWDFEGNGFRHWLFVKGSRLERFGFVAATDAPAQYSISLEEGTFPGWSIVSYESTALPAAIMDVYAQRCRDAELKITSNPGAKPGKAGTVEAALVCEIRPYIDAEFYAERDQAVAASRVVIKVWGSD